MLSTGMQNLTILALAVPEISLGGVSKFKVGPMAMLLLSVICHIAGTYLT